MTIRIIVLLVLALSTAGGSAFLAQNWLASERAEILASVPAQISGKNERKQVLVAKTDLVAGTFVMKEKLMWQPWPSDSIGEHMLIKGNVEMDAVVGSVIRSRIVAGQPVLPSALVEPGEQGFMAAVLTPGMRAVTVPISATSGVGGFVFPGDRVDIILQLRLDDYEPLKNYGKNFFFSQTLLRGVRVLGKDQSAKQQEGEVSVAKTVTLEVTPKEAEKVALAIQVGNLSLSLRSLVDEEMVLSQTLESLSEPERSALKHKASFELAGDETKKKAPPVMEEELSVTTELDVNYFFRKLAKERKSGAIKSSQKVQVSRGGQTTVREFKQ